MVHPPPSGVWWVNHYHVILLITIFILRSPNNDRPATLQQRNLFPRTHLTGDIADNCLQPRPAPNIAALTLTKKPTTRIFLPQKSPSMMQTRSGRPAEMARKLEEIRQLNKKNHQQERQRKEEEEMRKKDAEASKSRVDEMARKV